jgi:stage V sporulation protein G
VDITEIRIKLMDEDQGERLKAFCSITFDDAFVVRDLKIIEGSNGPFVAMPSRKLTSHCANCRSKNHLRAVYCNQCGRKLGEHHVAKDEDGRAKLYADIAHPINSECRDMIQRRVIQEYQVELVRSQQDDYVSRYDDLDLDSFLSNSDGKVPTALRVKTQIEGPEHQPPPPHLPTRQTAGEHPPYPGPSRGGFGEGIFE